MSGVQIYGAGAAGVATPMPAGTETHPISVVLADAPATAPLGEVRYSGIVTSTTEGNALWVESGVAMQDLFVRDVFITVTRNDVDNSLIYPINIVDSDPSFSTTGIVVGDVAISVNQVVSALGYQPLLDVTASAVAGLAWVGGRLPVNKRIPDYLHTEAGRRLGIASTGDVNIRLSFSFSLYPA
jgi:hypothetical protein